MDALDAIFSRRSIGRLTEPAPTPEDVTVLLRAAAAAPDHQSLRPWRFVVLEGETKARFGGLLARSYLARCADTGVDSIPAKEEKERTKLGRAPLVLIVAVVDQGDAVPFVEQFAAAAAAAQNVLLAATALGYGSMWRTGDAAYDERLKAAIGLGEADAIVGFLYVGTPHPDGAKPPNDPVIADVVTQWSSSP